MAAAEAALGKLRSLMPGIEVPHGELPEEWMRYACLSPGAFVFEPPKVNINTKNAQLGIFIQPSKALFLFMYGA